MDKFANALADAANKTNDNNDKIIVLLSKIENHLYRLDKGQDEIIAYLKNFIKYEYPDSYNQAIEELMLTE